MTDDITARIADIATDVLRGNAILGKAIAERVVQELELNWKLGELAATKALFETTQEVHRQTIRDFCILRDALPREKVARLLELDEGSADG